jgi:3-hydroxyacyl-CoA dehydrogenase
MSAVLDDPQHVSRVAPRRVRLETEGDVAVIALDNPPVNCLDLDTRRDLLEALDACEDDAAVAAVVLLGSGRNFSAGANLAEMDTPEALAEPNLHLTVISAIEAMTKPVVAAIHGVAMGGGLELALGCHYRLATADAQLALPEVTLGLLPGAGGTQRLPRALGLERGLNAMLSGKTMRGAEVCSTLLVAELVPADIQPAAVAFARGIAGQRPLPRLCDVKIEHPNAEGFLMFARNIVRADKRRLPGLEPIIDAVGVATRKPMRDGLDFEYALFRRLRDMPATRAFRHAFLAKRAASKIDGLPPATPVRRLERAAIVGAGTMGVGIAIALADTGLPVALLDENAAALDRAAASIRKTYEAAVQRGRLTAEAAAERAARIRPVAGYGDLADADIVIEAVFERMDVKEQVFRALDTYARPGAILATNTSSLDVDRIGSCTARPGDVVGMHFFSPANVMQLVEVVRGAATTDDVLATVMKLVRTMGKVAVVARVCDGFIGNRMIEQYMRQAQFLLDEGALPEQVDRALQDWGMAMGPFRMSDLAGNDIAREVRARRAVERPDMRYSKIGDKLCERGWLGQKTQRGWYRYEPGSRTPIPDPEVRQMIEAHSAELGIGRRQISDEEIVGRCIYALVNEGAALLEEGIAQRASDVDAAYLCGYGFPVQRGGPMFHAEMAGISNVVRTMRRFARNPHADPDFWRPAPLLLQLAATGGSFYAAGDPL